MSMMERCCRPTAIEVNLNAIRHNIEIIRDRLPDQVEVMAIVKANAYGHGAVPVARESLNAGATYLGVAFLDEAIELRRAGIEAPILILGYTPLDCLHLAQSYEITCTFLDADYVSKALASLSQDLPPLKVHIKIDSGMGRIGFTDLPSLLDSCLKIADSPKCQLEGVFTHFATADEQDETYTLSQYEQFSYWLMELKRIGIEPEIVHMNNSAAAIRYPDWGSQLGKRLVRFGIGLYGLQPSRFIRDQFALDLQPALSLKSQIIQLKQVAPGTTISYGRTYATEGNGVIATIPIGYGDGYSRLLSNRAEVLVRGRRARIVGRICMDQCMVDVTHIPGVQVGDEVVLIGKQGDEEITADELAERMGTINYEVVTILGKRIPRIYI
jgi:alanine racemase